jgi:hypothetical protein
MDDATNLVVTASFVLLAGLIAFAFYSNILSHRAAVRLNRAGRKIDDANAFLDGLTKDIVALESELPHKVPVDEFERHVVGLTVEATVAAKSGATR